MTVPQLSITGKTKKGDSLAGEMRDCIEFNAVQLSNAYVQNIGTGGVHSNPNFLDDAFA